MNFNGFSTFAVTPGVALVTRATKGLWVVATGDVTVTVGSHTFALTGVPANTHLPFATDAVPAATATIVGLY